MRHVILLSACLLACGGGDDATCGELPDGAYRAVWNEQSGSCGSFENVITMQSTPDVSGPDGADDTECVDDSTVSDDGCEVIVNERCPVFYSDGSPAGDRHIEGVLRANADGDGITGTLEVTERDEFGDLFCRGVGSYTVSML